MFLKIKIFCWSKLEGKQFFRVLKNIDPLRWQIFRIKKRNASRRSIRTFRYAVAIASTCAIVKNAATFIKHFPVSIVSPDSSSV